MVHVKMFTTKNNNKKKHPWFSVNIPLRDMNGRVSHAHDAPPEQETGGRGAGLVGEGAGSG